MTASSPDSLYPRLIVLHPGIAVDFGTHFRRPRLDASIKYYDSLYHVFGTNVKTE